MSATQLITKAYKDVVNTGSKRDVESAWAEYELRRRVHFALELMLNALTDTLIECKEATLDDILIDWSKAESEYSLPTLLSSLFSVQQSVFGSLIEDIETATRTDTWLNRSVPVSDARGLSSWCKSIFAVVVLIVAKNQTNRVRDTGQIPNRGTYLELAFSILEEEKKNSVTTVLRRLLSEIVIEAHLTTTLRKMSHGQKCSLRFYPEGNVLRPTGVPTTAGFSGDRLRNVLGMWADLGVLHRESGAFVLSERGRTLAAEL